MVRALKVPKSSCSGEMSVWDTTHFSRLEFEGVEFRGWNLWGAVSDCSNVLRVGCLKLSGRGEAHGSGVYVGDWERAAQGIVQMIVQMPTHV